MASKIYEAFRYSRVNPNLAKNLPTFQHVKDISQKRVQSVYVCGLGATGSLGLNRYYQPEKISMKKVRPKDVGSKTFRRLSLMTMSDNNIRDIACGHGFTVIAGNFKDTSHTCIGFGLNSHSQIGYQVSRPGFPLEIVNTPSPIFLPTNKPIVKVSCGRGHSLFLCGSGEVFSLGNNALGQCGRRIIEKEEYFGSKTINKLELPKNIINIQCGQDHSIFVTDDGKVFSCGWGADGQTGLGHYENQWKPTQVKGDIENVKIVKVSSFADTVLALDDKGNVFGWGNSEYSQFCLLSNNNSAQFNLPRHLELKTPGRVIDVAAGGTICAVLNDLGQVYVWGFGILGLGPNVDHSSKPLLIPETLFGINLYNPDVKVTSIHASLTHFAATNSEGDLFTWGKNRGQALGFAHGQDQFFPLRVDLNLTRIKRVALGVDHTCALVESVC